MFTNLINLFFPHVCAGCNCFLVNGEYVICTNCRHELPMTNHHLVIENEAFQKFYGKLPVEMVATMCYFHKKGIVQEMIHKLKYKGQEQIGTAIGKWYGDELLKLPVIQGIDAILPVPLHPKRLRERGYNQVTAFGKALSETLNIPFNDKILVRNVYSKSQTKKNRFGRSTNSKSVFDVNVDEIHKNKHFLLIDDVLTTGSTLESCGRALAKLGEIRISIVCIAMTK